MLPLNKKIALLLLTGCTHNAFAAQSYENQEEKKDMLENKINPYLTERITLHVEDFNKVPKCINAIIAKKKEIVSLNKALVELGDDIDQKLDLLPKQLSAAVKPNIVYIVQIISLYKIENKDVTEQGTGTIIANNLEKGYVLTCKKNLTKFHNGKACNATSIWIKKKEATYGCCKAYYHKTADIVLLAYIGVYNDLKTQILHTIQVGLPRAMTYHPYDDKYTINQGCIVGFRGNGKSQNKLWGISGELNIKLKKIRIAHTMPTHPGQSGAAIMCYDHKENKLTIAGIHTAGLIAIQTFINRKNFLHKDGTLINQEKTHWIENIVKDATHHQGYSEKIIEHGKKLKEQLKTLGKQHASTATTYHNLACAYGKQGKYDQAITNYKEALAIRLAVLGKHHGSTATTYHSLGSIYKRQDNWKQAMNHYKKALAIRLEILEKQDASPALNLSLSYLETHKEVMDLELATKDRMINTLRRDNANLRKALQEQKKLLDEKEEKLTQYTCLRTLQGHTASVQSVAFAPDGKILASSSWDTTIRIWDSATYQSLRTLKQHTAYVYGVAFTPNGKILVSTGRDKTIRIWDTSAWQCLRTLQGHTRSVYSIAFSPDGKTFASASDDNSVKMWDTVKGTCLRTLKGHPWSITGVAFAPDGKTLASASADSSVKIWCASMGGCLHTLRGHNAGVVSVAFAPNGKTLASASHDKTLRIWNPAKGTCMRTLEGHTQVVNSVTFAHDGKTLASASDDKSVKIWDTNTWKCLRTLKGHTSPVLRVAFAPDGKTLASSGDDKSVKIWQV